jgi:hypothetical protein
MQPIVFRDNTFCTTNSLLTATGAVTTHDSTVLLQYCIKGKAYNKSGTNATQATPTTDVNTGTTFVPLTANQGCLMVWGYDSAGTVKVAQGNIVALDAGVFKLTPQFPSIPDTICPFAYQVLKAGSTAGTVAFGTSNWNATGFTNAIVNILTLPNRGQIA